MHLAWQYARNFLHLHCLIHFSNLTHCRLILKFNLLPRFKRLKKQKQGLEMKLKLVQGFAPFQVLMSHGTKEFLLLKVKNLLKEKKKLNLNLKRLTKLKTKSGRGKKKIS